MVKTPQDKWNDTILKLRKQCQNIMKVSDNIRYAGVINEYGRTLTGMVKPGIKPLLKSEQVKNEFFIMSTLITLRQNAASAVGNLEYVVLKHAKVSIILLQKNKITFYVSIDNKEKTPDKLILKIKKII
ncbi:hypothetical protein C6988_05945 [Nitrosopumilus sp. b1]|uniref:hypothetical protein n=1 Tax=Nitrosopumilus sp. b1 TaxID=2109907 RepID=UPI0015F46AEA|nr:hypothetical protein [Nitrosopumilus sp. b1]KAF6242729.1 hypothetical protein C6988_05945 [Nitrosopumilus sp. b1]